MKTLLRSSRRLLERFGIAVTRPETLHSLSTERRAHQRTQLFHEFLERLKPEAMARALAVYPQSFGENFQDIFVLLVLDFQREGFFVEFGATDGVEGSNSCMMERSFGWAGLLSEPARRWQGALRRNRRATICEKCVWSETGQHISFREATDAGFSTVDQFSAQDRHADRRRDGRLYNVETISLNDLLRSHDAPTKVSYLSIDTEGSEFTILSALDFAAHSISVLTVEHNFRPERDDILALMTHHGYRRAPIAASKYDDWYVAAHLAPRLAAIFRDFDAG